MSVAADTIPSVEVAALVVSVVAMLVSGFALWQNKRQADAGAKVADIETMRARAEMEASLSAQLVVMVTDRHGANVVLSVRNDGHTTARAVGLALEVVLGDVGTMPVIGTDPFPCEIQPGAAVRMPMWCAGSAVDRLQVSVSWTDGLGAHEETLKVPLY